MINLEKHDMVFFKCSNPGVGIIKRVSKDNSWADVCFIDFDKILRARRIETKHLEVLNPVLNYWNTATGIIKEGHFSHIPEQIKYPENSMKEITK